MTDEQILWLGDAINRAYVCGHTTGAKAIAENLLFRIAEAGYEIKFLEKSSGENTTGN
jgi:hypothetical protein